MKLGHWPKKNARSCTYTVFLRQGIKIELIFTLQAASSEIRANFQNCYIRAWNLAFGQSPEVAHIYALRFYPRGSNLSLFFLCGKWFPRYEPIFKIAIFGHETWSSAKVPEVCTYMCSLFLPREGGGLKLSLFSPYVHRFPRYWPIFKIAIFGCELLGH